MRAWKNYLWPRVLGESLGEQEQDREVYASTEVCPDKCAERNKWEDLRTQMVGFHLLSVQCYSTSRYLWNFLNKFCFFAHFQEKQVRLYDEDGYSFWHQQQLRPFGFVETATLVKSRTHPFKKDTTFSTPLQEICTGREPPFKEFRDLKFNLWMKCA